MNISANIKLFVNGIEQPFLLPEIDPNTLAPLGDFSRLRLVDSTECFLVAPENTVVTVKFELNPSLGFIIDDANSLITAYGQLLLYRGLPPNFEIGSL